MQCFRHRSCAYLMKHLCFESFVYESAQVDATIRDWCGPEAPQVITIPCYSERCIMTSRDPRAVIHNYLYQVKARLPVLLGLRMCPECPKCNSDWKVTANGKHTPCQNRFGSNMMACGGCFGACISLGGSTEYQELSAPHLHIQVNLSNVILLT